VETAMSRYKAIIGGSMRSRTMPSQKTEAAIACAVLNRMTHLDMPDGYYRDRFGRETVEVAHEALLRVWPQLDTWLEEDQDKLRLFESVRSAGEDWQRGDRVSELLVHRGDRLSEALALADEPRFALEPGSVEAVYLKECSTLQRKREDAERAQEQTHRAGKIFRQLREFVSTGTTQRESVDIDQLIRDVIDLLEWGLRNSQVKIEFNHCGHDCRVLVDKVQIEQVILNLVRNSLEAIQNAGTREGRVVLKTHRMQGNGNMVEVTVSDNGPGIDVGMTGKLFNPFHTSKVAGMGMGLSISRSIIEAHGGKIWVDEVHSDGAVLGFNLPLAGA
jgi:signal transduction histidine kinase